MSQASDTQNDTSELRQHLYNLFGQNFLDGDKPSEWKATTMNASEVKEFIDEFVVPLIAQREQAAHLDELKWALANCDPIRVGDVYSLDVLPSKRIIKRLNDLQSLQATKPEKEG